MNQESSLGSGLDPKRRALFEKLLEQEKAGSISTSTIARRPTSGSAPLSFAQERLWFLDQLDADSAVYNLPIGLHLDGELDAAALQRSLEEVVRRHEALRTCFKTVAGRPVQVVEPVDSLAMPAVDLSGQPEHERSAAAMRMCAQEGQRPFDLRQAPMLRAKLFRLTPRQHLLLLTLHHVAADGWSIGVLLRELARLYEAFSAGRPSPLAELPIQYADFAVWQHDWLQGEVLEKQLGYWKKQLNGVPALLELPPERPRPARRSYRGARETAAFPQSLLRALEALSREEGATLFMTLLAAFQTLLCRYSGQEDVLVGSPIAGRNRAEVEGLIGFFVNTLVLRGDLSGNPTYRDLLRRVKEVTLAAYAHQDLPFEKLVEELHPERNLSYSPLFQILFTLQNTPSAPARLGELKMRSEVISCATSRFDLSVFMTEGTDGLKVAVEYCTELFDREMILRLLNHFRVLLQGIAADPDRRIMMLPLLGAAERRKLLVEWNQTAASYPQDKCVHELFEEQVRRSPDVTALVHGDRQLTFGELNRRANQLAHKLRELGVGPEVLVGVCVERSLEMVVALLGTLKAGGAYVPLDPAYPKERLAYMLGDAAPKVLLAQERLVESLPQHDSVVCLDRDWAQIEAYPELNLQPLSKPENLAYVIYTSGSTGTPKGVGNTVRGLCNRLWWFRERFAQGPEMVFAVKTSIGFVDSVTEILSGLVSRARLVLVEQEKALMLDDLLTCIDKDGITHIVLVPSLLALLLKIDAGDRMKSLRTIVCSGESLPNDLVRGLHQVLPQVELFNFYGSSEVNGDSTFFDTRDFTADRYSSVIGRPIANTQIHILDRGLKPVPVGVTGELHIGGAGLARGYLNRPELTAEKFIANPFGEPGARLYKTGDLARYLPDGNIEYLGRIDHQVKLRGFRIELGEIESVLQQDAQVSQAVVMLREDSPGDKRLVAYVVGADAGFKQGAGLEVEGLKQGLRTKLPEYMVPAHFVSLEALPLTPSGKVDRKQLPVPERSAADEANYVAPRTATEKVLADIWCKALRLKQVGVHDNFFELGGHSMMIVRLICEINPTYRTSLGVLEIFRHPTVEQLARVIDARRPDSGPRPAVIQLQKGPAELSVYFIYAGPHEFRLAQSMGERHPVFGIEVPLPVAWRDAVHANRRSDYPTMEQLVARYVAALSAHAGSSPCVLAGHSFAGLIAFEAAHQIQKQGGKVELVILFDARAAYPAPYRVAWHQLRECWKPALAGLPGGRFLQSTGSRLKSSWRIIRWLFGKERDRVRSFFHRAALNPDDLTAALDEQGMPLPWGLMKRLYMTIEKPYRRRRLDSRGILFRSVPDGDKGILPVMDDSLGWNNLFTRGMEIIPVAGDHLSMFREHNLTLAHELNEVLKRHSPVIRDSGQHVTG